MRRTLCLVVWGLAAAACLSALMLAATACAPEPEPAASYLEVYKPSLTSFTPQEEAAWESLPRYEISATLDVSASLISGWERVRFKNWHANELNEIYFRLYPNLPQQGGSLTVQSITSEGMLVEFDYDFTGTSLVINCDPPLRSGQVAEIYVTFTTTIPQSTEGWTIFGYSQKIYSLPDFYPILAVYDGQGWSRELPPAYADAGFSESAFYKVNFTASPDLAIACTGNIITQTLQSDGNLLTEIVGGPIREFVILASADYEIETLSAYGTTVKSVFLREDRRAGVDALWRAVSALRIYSDTFGPYPFTEMTIAEAPLQFRGMEYSTLNLLGIDLYRSNRTDLSYLTIHEIAHQWWYSQVGNDPYNSPWLDEGLAEYSGYTYYWGAYGRAAAEQLREIRWQRPYQFAKDNDANTILAQPASAFAGARAYESMVYAKSALFFDALRRAVGDDVYYAILQEYARRYRFQIVAPEQFFLIAQEVSGRDLMPLIQEWVLTAQ